MRQSEALTQQITALVARINNSERAAFEELIDLVHPNLFRFSFHLASNRQLAEDVCQETFFRILVSIKSLRDPLQFFGWALMIARNVYVDMVRDLKSEVVLDEPELESVLAENDDPRVKEDILRVQSTLNKIDADSRTLVILIYILEYTYKETAEMLGITENLVKSRAYWARKRFMQKFNKLSA